MGNPNITRLGKIQMWYKNHYSDFSYVSNFKKLRTFEQLLNTYFNYGLLFQSNTLLAHFWYKNPFLKSSINQSLPTKTTLYFRKYYYAHKTLSIEHSYFLRLKTREFFPLRLYVLKYNNWVIISVQWFKPLKHNLVNKSNMNRQGMKKSNSTIIFKDNKFFQKKYKRLRLLLFFIKTSTRFYDTYLNSKYNF